MSRKKLNLAADPVIPTIIKMAGGMLFGFLAMSAFNTADTYFVGQLGTTELAAMSFTFPVIMVLNSVSLGMGVGLSSTVSRAIGSGNHDKVKRLTTDGMMLSILIVLLLGILGITTIDPVFKALGAGSETLPLIKSYMFIWYFGFPFVVIPMAGNNVIRATGDTLTPSINMIISMVVNVILDPLLIFGIGPFPEMGIAGAALATVFARISSMFFSLYILTFREKLLSFKRIVWKKTFESWKEIAFVGFPAAVVQAINPFSLSIITRLLSGYGKEVVAGYGAASKFEMMILIIPMAMSAVMTPFTGQNWGAKQIDRIKKGIAFTSIASISWGILMFILFQFLASPILSLFNEHPEVINAGASYLRIISISYGFFAMTSMASMSFNALNKPQYAAVVTVTKAFILNIPLAVLGGKLMGGTGIFGATMLTNIIGGAGGVLMVLHFLKKHSEAKAEAV